MIFLGISGLGVWAYQQLGGIEGLKSLLSTDGKPVTEQTGAGEPSADGSSVTDQTGAGQPTGDNVADLVNIPEGSTETNTINDFAGEWGPATVKAESRNIMDNTNIIIKHDDSGNLVIYYEGYESAAEKLNYSWSKIEGNKVRCKMSHKDDPGQTGNVEMKLSADKKVLMYSTLKNATMEIIDTHNFIRIN